MTCTKLCDKSHNLVKVFHAILYLLFYSIQHPLTRRPGVLLRVRLAWDLSFKYENVSSSSVSLILVNSRSIHWRISNAPGVMRRHAFQLHTLRQRFMVQFEVNFMRTCMPIFEFLNWHFPTCWFSLCSLPLYSLFGAALNIVMKAISDASFLPPRPQIAAL